MIIIMLGHLFEKESKRELFFFLLSVNGVGEEVSTTLMMGKVIRPLRSVDPSQTEYQGLIEITEEGWCQTRM